LIHEPLIFNIAARGAWLFYFSWMRAVCSHVLVAPHIIRVRVEWEMAAVVAVR
jgi:hypothetical protein